MMVSTAAETDRLEKMFDDLVVTRSNPYSADLLSKGTSKIRGIKRLGEIFGFDLTEAMAFGDSDNDMAMLKNVGIGVAMGNATPQVKEIADYVTTSNGNDGIARALAYYGLVSFDDKASFVSKDLTFNKVKDFHRLMDGVTQEIPKVFSPEEAEHRSDFKIEEIVEFLYAVADGNSVRFDEMMDNLHAAIDKGAQKVLNQSVDSQSDALTAQTDSLIDLLYFTYGSLVLSGVDPYEIFNIVHKANMAKIFPDGHPHFDSVTGKLLKPDNWHDKYSPENDIKKELNRQTRVSIKKMNK
jgi:predicted HAD superfamily Cof-like phosphohydrolase